MAEHFEAGFNNAAVRMLQSQAAAFDESEKVAQIFSGVFFSGLAIWLTLTNGANLAYIQQASLEKRLVACSYICAYIAMFSAFFNFFQLTDVQRYAIPRPSNYVLDLARPVEWIFTCPLIQLEVVLFGGSRLPASRRFIMPGLTLTFLFCGLASQLTPVPYNYVLYFVGVLVNTVQQYLNRQQIIEHSNGEEGLFRGESDFRRLSIMVMAAWFPFPIWYIVSPEGIGIITDVTILQCGWAFLNIVAKFSFIFFIQRIKDNYCGRLKVKRELHSTSAVQSNQIVPVAGNATPPILDIKIREMAQLNAIVAETMGFLGMSQHQERLLRLLNHANISSIEQVEALTQRKCEEKLQLPWDLISSLQKRIQVWKMQMGDHAEKELERGELHYMEAGFEEGQGGMYRQTSGDPQDRQHMYRAATPPNMYMEDGRSTGARTPVGGPLGPMGPMVPVGYMNEAAEAGQQRSQEMLAALLEKTENVHAAVLKQQAEAQSSILRKVEEMIAKSLSATKRAQEAEVEGNLQQRLEELVASATERVRASADSVALNLQSKVDDYHAQQSGSSKEAESQQARRVEEALRRSTEAQQRSIEQVSRDLAKSDAQQAAMNRKIEELERNMSRKLDELGSRTAERSDRTAELIRSAVQADMSTLMGRSDLVGEAVREANHGQKEAIADLRRLSMMVLDQVNGTQERSQQQVSSLMELRGSLDAGFERMLASLADVKLSAGRGAGTPASQPLLQGDLQPGLNRGTGRY